MNKDMSLKVRELVGMVLAEDIINPETRVVLVYAGTMLTEHIMIGLIEDFGVDDFRV